MLLVDTNVLIDVLQDDPSWADWSVRQLRDQAQVHELFINPVIYSELSLAFDSVGAVDEAIEDMGLSYQELRHTDPRWPTLPQLFSARDACRARRQPRAVTITRPSADLWVDHL